MVDKMTQELVKGLDFLKEADKWTKERIDQPKGKITYVEREENLELKQLYEEELKNTMEL